MNLRWHDRGPGTVAAAVGTTALGIAGMLALVLQPRWESEAGQAWREARQVEQQRAEARARRLAAAATAADRQGPSVAMEPGASALWMRLEAGGNLQVRQWRGERGGERGGADGPRDTGRGAAPASATEVTTVLRGTYAALRDGLARGHADPSVELLSLRLQRTDDPGGGIEAEARWRLGVTGPIGPGRLEARAPAGEATQTR